MVADVSFTLTGAEALSARLESLTYETKRKGGRSALRKAAQVIRDRAKEGAARLDDEATGRRIADNVAERWDNRRFKSTGDLAFRVGILKGAKIKPGNPDEGESGPTPHWRLLEFGTEKMQAQPFMRPAMDQTMGEVAAVFIREYNKAIDRALKRAAKTGVKA